MFSNFSTYMYVHQCTNRLKRMEYFASTFILHQLHYYYSIYKCAYKCMYQCAYKCTHQCVSLRDFGSYMNEGFSLNQNKIEKCVDLFCRYEVDRRTLGITEQRY